MSDGTDHLLEVLDLSVEFHTAQGVVEAVRGVDFHLDAGETLAILGESGSGKSVSASAIMDIIDSPPGYITSGRILFEGLDEALVEDRRYHIVPTALVPLHNAMESLDEELSCVLMPPRSQVWDEVWMDP